MNSCGIQLVPSGTKLSELSKDQLQRYGIVVNRLYDEEARLACGILTSFAVIVGCAVVVQYAVVTGYWFVRRGTKWLDVELI